MAPAVAVKPMSVDEKNRAIRARAVAEAKKFYPLFGMFANVALVVSGSFVTFVANLRKNAPQEEGVDPWQMSLVYLITGCLVSGGCLIAAFAYMQRCVVNDPTLVEQSQTTKAKSKSKMSMGESIKYLAGSPYILDLGILVIGYGMAINLIEVTWKSRLQLQFPPLARWSAPPPLQLRTSQSQQPMSQHRLQCQLQR